MGKESVTFSKRSTFLLLDRLRFYGAARVGIGCHRQHPFPDGSQEVAESQRNSSRPETSFQTVPRSPAPHHPCCKSQLAPAGIAITSASPPARFVDDKFESDVTAGEDPIVRQAALDALGNMNGTVLAIEPTSGRVLAMVNQKLALSSGAQPCSTIKLSVALAALAKT